MQLNIIEYIIRKLAFCRKRIQKVWSALLWRKGSYWGLFAVEFSKNWKSLFHLRVLSSLATARMWNLWNPSHIHKLWRIETSFNHFIAFIAFPSVLLILLLGSIFFSAKILVGTIAEICSVTTVLPITNTGIWMRHVDMGFPTMSQADLVLHLFCFTVKPKNA